MADIAKWATDGVRLGWQMPPAPRWKRLPIVRHLRAVWAAFMVERHYSRMGGLLGLRTGYDEWVLFGIWHGQEPAHD